jgi:trans-aconitate methyltransferase
MVMNFRISIFSIFAQAFLKMPTFFFNWFFSGLWIKEDRTIKNKICKKIIALILKNTSQELNKEINLRLWKTEAAKSWHERLQKKYEEKGIEPYRQSFIDNILQVLERQKVNKIVEIGCGNGLTLKRIFQDLMNKKISGKYNFFGFDLNFSEKSADTNIKIANGGFEKLYNFKDDKVLVYAVAVFTCIDKNELKKVLHSISQMQEGSILAICEPVIFENNQILDKTRSEIAYSHNYLKTFGKNFELIFEKRHLKHSYIELFFIKS